MSGHSKWSTIKRKKAANDARRGNAFTRLAREIAVAAREGGGDQESNVNLRLAVDRAKAENMPKDNIERAIRRGTGEDKEGEALMIEVITDNRNRTVADIRHMLTRAGGNMAEAGSVAWQFHRSAYFLITGREREAEKIFEMAVEAGADDVSIDGDIEIIAPVEAFKSINDRLEQAGIEIEEASLRWLPNAVLPLAPDETVQVMRLIESLEDLDDVTQVYSNLEVSEAAVELLETA
jgi:YebC/PmpR family DNA-binding regulatory protein